MDDSGFTSETVQQITIGIVAKYTNPCVTSGTYSGTVGICYTTGTATVCTDVAMTGDFTTYTTAAYTTDSDGGSLDSSDIDNLQVEIRRRTGGSPNLIVTEVYADVEYLP